MADDEKPDEQNQADRQGLVTGRHVGIQPVEIRDEIQNAYLDYAMSVIVGRALPDVRDGLKPVHRRVIYAMYDGGYRPDRGWNKCSRVVGDVMGKYHPHGDSAIYDTLVRLAQPWAMRYKLVQGQGNFGSQGNDGAAAMRYTECKMAPLAMEMVRDIDQDTVDFQPNYDNKETEPVVLPSRFPNLLVNGSSGIAVGMATNIPTHNLREVNEAVQWSLAHPDASSEELLHVYNIVQPRNVMPIHGEIRHLVANGGLAVKTGIAPERVMLCEDGVAVDLEGGVARIAGQVPCGYIYVDGSSVGEIDEAELKDRRILAEEGFVSVYAVVETTTGTILAGPHIQARGVAEDDSVFEEILPDVTEALSAALETGKADAYSLQQVMRRTLGRWIGRRLRRRPMIVPVVIEA